MSPIILAPLCLAAALAGEPVPHACPQPWDSARAAIATIGDEKAVKALEAWLRLYRAGKIEFLSKQDVGKESLAAKFGLTAKGRTGDATWAGDLDLILEALAKLDTAEAATAMLEVAAIGIDNGKYTVPMAPYAVREAGERWIGRLKSDEAKAAIGAFAAGTGKVDRARAVAMRVAAIRMVGALHDRSQRAALEAALHAEEETVRVTAAEALGALGDIGAAEALVRTLEQDGSDAVLPAAVQALRDLYRDEQPKPAAKTAGDGATPPAAQPPAILPAGLQAALRAAIAALGRTTWRADLALVKFLGDYPTKEAVAALIGMLERFKAHPEEVQSGKLSGLLRHRVHETLVTMTGAVFAADEPEKWREMWDREQDKFVAHTGEAAKAASTSAAGFCGVPVQGTRIVFVLDLSGSMEFPMTGKGTDSRPRKETRLDFAKRELHRAVEAITADAQFNLVTFNGNPKAKVWSKDLVPATDRNKERFLKYVDDLRADGGTNLWSGLEDGLKIKSLVLGSRYETNVDEVFVLSDGAPSVGDVLDPIEILRLVHETNRYAKTRINTVFISSIDPADRQAPMPWMTITPEDLMKRMAEQNGGKFVNL